MKISDSGLEKIISSFDRIDGTLEEIAEKAIYKAAGMIADEVKKGIQSIPIQENDHGKSPYMKKGQRLTGITSAQKSDLINSLGIAKFRKEDGAVNTSIGFSGTGSTTSKKHPKGLPNRTLMRSIESGSSLRQKHPVVRQALNSVRKRATETIKNEVTEQIKKEI